MVRFNCCDFVAFLWVLSLIWFAFDCLAVEIVYYGVYLVCLSIVFV